MIARDLIRHLRAHADPEIAAHSQRFFRAIPGGYGEGDRFLGIRVPVVRRVARGGRTLPLRSVLSILRSRWHEERLLALVIMVEQFRRGDHDRRHALHEAYLAHTAHVNNWDLVDTSAHVLVGEWLLDSDRQLLGRLARSRSLWEQRIAIIATLAFIRNGQFDDTLAVADRLLDHEHDLIHKAVGWMLREVGNRDRSVEEAFLQPRYRAMPRTMLRYAIEKFPERRRQAYLKGTA
jgi:3-methyladenine DNA glycosylase AlkD